VDSPEERDETAVQYIIGGQGQGGVGNTLTVNVPGLLPGAAALPGAPAIGPAAGLPPAAQQYVPVAPTLPAKK